MKIISGLFDTREEAERAVDALEDAGIASDDISVIGPEGNTAPAVPPKARASGRQSAASAACLPDWALLQFRESGL